MNISIFGLGYVGCVSVGCLAEQGHHLFGVDVQKDKIERINNGKPTIIENGIDDLILKNFGRGRISATMDYQQAVINTKVSFICVGTPVSEKGDLNLEYVFRTASNIGESLRDKSSGFPHIIVLRSTVPPGTNRKVADIISQMSGKKDEEHFHVVSNPEFLREGTAISDFMNPPYTVVGTASDEAFEKMKELYSGIDAPLLRTEINEAEILKYINNSFHALKITFANEVGNICKMLGIDSHMLMDIFCMDKKLNLSPYYLKPGFAYGGSCLPKDLKALTTMASNLNLQTPTLDSISLSNENQKKHLLDYIISRKAKKIGIIGITFKDGTDDVRNSPIIDVINRLNMAGDYQVIIYDNNLINAKIFGESERVINKLLSNESTTIVKTLDRLVDKSELIIVNRRLSKLNVMATEIDKPVIDLVRNPEIENSSGYYGIAW